MHYYIVSIRNFDFDNPLHTACGSNSANHTKTKAEVTCKKCLSWIKRTDDALRKELERQQKR